MLRIFVLNALSGLNWGQLKEVFIYISYKILIGAILDDACPAWSHSVSDTSIKKQIMLNAGLWMVTGFTKMSPNDHFAYRVQTTYSQNSPQALRLTIRPQDLLASKPPLFLLCSYTTVPPATRE